MAVPTHLDRSVPEVYAEVGDLVGLGGVLAWMTRRGIPLSAVEITQQDEFSLDFVVPLPESRWMVFGIT